MSDNMKPIILAVDDEESILKALKRLFGELDASFISASCGEDALEILKDNKVALIISDQRMPGMSGVEFLGRSRSFSPDSIRILLTGYADINATIEAINRGSVEYYMNKPWDDDLLISRVRESINLYKVLVENRQLQDLTRRQNDKLQELNNSLEQKVKEQTSRIKRQNDELAQSFMETIRTFSSLIELRSKEVGSHSQRVAGLVKELLKGMDVDEKQRQDIIVAAFLHDIGKISVPDKILNKNKTEYTRADKEFLKKHVALGQSSVFAISGFEDIGLIIRHHHENYDGTGYPDNLSGDIIPLGSRIIRVAEAFDYHAFINGYPNDNFIRSSTANLVKYSGPKYDPLIVKQFIESDLGKTFLIRESTDIIQMQPHNLEAKMVVASDIYTHNGMFLLPKGAVLSNGMIKRLTNINNYDPISKGVFVYAPERKVKKVNRHARV